VKFKLDENLAERHCLALEAVGHDVSTVKRQGISGATDSELFSICRREERVLVTLDLDFSNVFEFPPEGTAGIVVLRARNLLIMTIDGLIENLIQALVSNDPIDSLWIVEHGRLRIHLNDER